MSDDKVRVRYLGGDRPTQGRWGYESFEISGDTAWVSAATAQSMVTEQPKLWSYVKDAESRAVEAKSDREAARVGKDVREASGKISEQISPDPRKVDDADTKRGGSTS